MGFFHYVFLSVVQPLNQLHFIENESITENKNLLGGEIKVFVVSWHCKKNKCSTSLECCLGGSNSKGRENTSWMAMLSCVRVHIWSRPNRCSEPGCRLGVYPLLNNSTSEIQLWFHICVVGIHTLSLQNKSNTFWWLLLSKITVHKWSMTSYMSLFT